jgi:hypothetical protein
LRGQPCASSEPKLLYVFKLPLAQCFGFRLKSRATSPSAGRVWVCGTQTDASSLLPLATCRAGNAHMFLCCLTFDMSGPPPAWPAQRTIDLGSGAGQAGGGPLDGRVRQHCVLPLSASSVGLNGRRTQGRSENTQRSLSSSFAPAWRRGKEQGETLTQPERTRTAVGEQPAE